MRRLPARWMLDELIRRQAWQEADIRRIAERLGRFYRDGAALDVSPAQYLKRLACDIESHGRALSDPAHGLPPSRVEGIMQAQREYLQRQQDLFVRRVSAGRLVEGHGDLRPEHICLKPEPVVFDCLEFNRGFRIVDPLDELAFLALECERLGAPAIGPLLLATYQTVTHDQAPARLLDFYTSLRACLRAKLALWHKQDSAPADWPRWNATAHNYLQWAGRYCGLPPSTTAPEDGCDPLPPSAPDDSHGQQFDQ
jgi:aminoglycoside phosphotransferase family enzyme